MLKKEKGFTLIEILTVVVIIVILASALAPRFFGRTEEARVAAAKSDIATIELGLDAYEADNGFYPTTEQGLESLVNPPATQPMPANWKGPYLKKRPGNDPWGSQYIYMCPGANNANGYDLFSYGRDGKEGGVGPDADITNWSEQR